MIFDQALLEALENCQTRPFENTVWRGTLGSRPALQPNSRGARWNPPGTSALYTSLVRATAEAECEHLLDVQGIRPSKVRPAFLEVKVKLSQVLDLSSLATLRDVGLDLRHLPETIEGYEPCQVIGGATEYLGYEGLLVPSVRLKNELNLVIFTANIKDGSFFELITEG